MNEPTILIFVLLSALAANIWWTVDAKRTDSMLSAKTPEEALVAVERAFSVVSWGRVDGPGAVNRRFRAPIKEGPTISVDLTPSSNGTQVDVWMSGWGSYLGVVYWGFNAFMKKRRVMRSVA